MEDLVYKVKKTNKKNEKICGSNATQFIINNKLNTHKVLELKNTIENSKKRPFNILLQRKVVQLQAVEIYCHINGTYRTVGRKGKTAFNERNLFLIRHDAHPQGQNILYGKMAIRKLRKLGIIPPVGISHDIQYTIQTYSRHVG